MRSASAAHVLQHIGLHLTSRAAARRGPCPPQSSWRPLPTGSHRCHASPEGARTALMELPFSCIQNGQMQQSRQAWRDNARQMVYPLSRWCFSMRAKSSCTCSMQIAAHGDSRPAQPVSSAAPRRRSSAGSWDLWGSQGARMHTGSRCHAHELARSGCLALY